MVDPSTVLVPPTVLQAGPEGFLVLFPHEGSTGPGRHPGRTDP